MIDVKKIAEQAGINTCLWNYGSRSLVFTESCEGVARAEFEAFAALVLEEAAKRCDQRYGLTSRDRLRKVRRSNQGIEA